VARQEEDCRAYAARQGWTVTEIYRENDTSAFMRRVVRLPDGSRASRVVRPEFRRMLSDLAEGTIDAVTGYDLDRVARDPRDLEDLIDVCETTGRPARSVTGNLDLSHDGGITMARVAVAMANQASRDTSRRVRRVKQDLAARGMWGGGGKRAFGYLADRSAIVAAEAAVIRGAAARVLAGDSLNAITADLVKSRALTVSGRPWNRTSLRGVLMRPTVAGLLVHRGQIVGTAPWPAILDEATWRSVVATIEARPKNDQSLRYWLTGIVVCGLCGAALRGNQGGYVCAPGDGGCNRIWVKVDHVEAAIEQVLLARLTRTPPPAVAVPSPPPDDSQLAELAVMWGRQEISLAEYRAARAEVIKRLQTETKPTVRLPAWARSDLRERWPELTPLQRRTIAAALIAAVHVARSPTSHRWNPSRLTVAWR
jgi:site-specific DNA recombinase